MITNEERSFFLYHMGRGVKDLCLGNLVLGDYANPTTARHYTHRPLTDLESAEYATVLELEECSFRRSSSYSPGMSVFASGFGQVYFGFDLGNETLVTARQGKRIVLKRAEEFLNSEILKVAEAQNVLRKWLSAARSDFFLKLKTFRTPKIWMLTGMYILEDATVFSMGKRSTESSIAAGTNTVLDLLTVPVGGSIGLGHSNYLESKTTLKGSYVWAAQYQLLEVKYLKVEPGQDLAALPISIPLYPRTSYGVIRSSSAAVDANEVQVSLAETNSSNTELQQIGHTEDEERYDAQLNDAIQSIEEILQDAI